MHLRTPMCRRSLFVGVAVLTTVYSGMAMAQELIDARDSKLVLDALRSFGYNATLTVDDVGDPKITGRMSRSTYEIFFYNCTDNDRCGFIQFSVGWDLADGISSAKINEWNSTKVWGQASRDDEDDPFLRMVVNLDGGVTRTNFEDTIDWFRIALEGFESHIGF